jgi:hypothetical protein
VTGKGGGITLARLVRSVAPGQSLVDLAYLFHPLVALAVLQVQDIVERPVEVIGNVRYLLVECVRGVAAYSPASGVSSSVVSSSDSSLIFL